MKVFLFLDFDGVLHPSVRGEPVFCRLPLLWKILRANQNVQVVFSTSWRRDYPLEMLIEFVTYGGGEGLANRIIGCTPSLESAGRNGRRELEIQNWLDANKRSHSKWIAVDDQLELFAGGHSNLFLVDGTLGLTNADVANIIEKLEYKKMETL